MADEKEEKKGPAVVHGFHHESATPAAKFIEQSESKTVTMIFPRRVMLVLDSHQKIEFQAGTQEVPRELVHPKLHFYLEAHGVKPYVPVAPVVQGVAEETATPVTLEEKEVANEEEEQGEEEAEEGETESAEISTEDATVQRRRPEPRRRRRG